MISEMHGELEPEKQAGHDRMFGHGGGWEPFGRCPAMRSFFQLPGTGTLVGALFCFLAAFLTGTLAGGFSWRAEVPLLFTVIPVVAAYIFGAWAGVVGTVLSALAFATHLFNPLGNLRVANDAARSNLGWMLMMGIAFSFLFAPQKSTLRRG